MTTIEYQDRYCAFVDILGFRNLVESLETDNRQFQELKALLRRVHDVKRVDAGEARIVAQSISDAVALSAPITPVGLMGLFEAVKELYIDLLCQGYFMRGAIVRGKLYHEGQTMFGSALVRAYQFEAEIARYPRVIVTQEVRDNMLANTGRGEEPYSKIHEELKQSSDGPMHLHVLGPIVALLNKDGTPYSTLTAQEKATLARYRGIKPILQERFAASMDNPRHFEKVRWVAEYWNAEIPSRFGLRIHGAGLDAKQGLRG
jgi:hypothetical protein